MVTKIELKTTYHPTYVTVVTVMTVVTVVTVVTLKIYKIKESDKNLVLT